MKRFLIVILTFALVCNAAQARKVTGTVQSGKEKLSGVIVTDGKNFTETRKGKFAFDIEDDSEFVFIVTPAGYTADFSSGVPAFYIPADGCSKFNFELQKLGEAGDYSLIAVEILSARLKSSSRSSRASLCRTSARPPRVLRTLRPE
jgi:hypothetical protein